MTGTPTDPAHTALLVMDYQQPMLGSFDHADVLVSRACEAIATVRGHSGHIGFVRVGFTEADYAAIPASSPMAMAATGARREALRSDSPTTAVDERLDRQPGDITVRKTRVGAFSTTDLDDQLRARGITTLILAGIATSGVVLSTVRDAADRDYRTLVLADACSDHDPEVHRLLTERIFPRQATVLEVAELEAELSAPPRR